MDIVRSDGNAGLKDSATPFVKPANEDSSTLTLYEIPLRHRLSTSAMV